MAIRTRLFPTDEELGKRDDDHKPSRVAGWLPKQRPKIRKRRLFAFVVVCALLWLFVRNVPDLGPADERYGFLSRRRGWIPTEVRARSRHAEGSRAVPREPQTDKDSTVFNSPPSTGPRPIEGPIRFVFLGHSLHGISRTNGHRPKNRNVLFAASDLKSAADIIPLACEMGRWKRNFVHMAVFGREELPIDDIKKVNGVTEESCDIFWHDARPNDAPVSTDARMEASVFGAFRHFEEFMHPQAVITAEEDDEDAFFTRGATRKLKELRQTHIEVPREHLDSLLWMTRLESSALRAWHSSNIEVLVQAPKDASGSLIRLLRSLEKADYAGFLPPRLTVELSYKLNQQTMAFVDGFMWPPKKYQSAMPRNELTLRRRIPGRRLSPDEASSRFVESFYPTSTQNSHLLVLSPQAELSPVYFQYLKYHLLQYKYSSTNATNLFGISLESPSVYLNGTDDFKPPAVKSSEKDSNLVRPYLWQAPNSNAALYFGERWIELHSFLTKFLAASQNPETEEHLRTRKRVISQRQPAWTESLLDLMRARGSYLLYPGVDPSFSRLRRESLAIIHNEMYIPPEEFSRPEIETRTAATPLSSPTTLEVPADYIKSHHDTEASSTSDRLNDEQPLHRNLLPFLPALPSISPSSRDSMDSDKPLPSLQPLSSLPLLDFRGEFVSHGDLEERSEHVTVGYRRAAGGCSENRSHDNGEVLPGNADDLFCLGDDDDDGSRERASRSAAAKKASSVDVDESSIRIASPKVDADLKELRDSAAKSETSELPRIHSKGQTDEPINLVSDSEPVNRPPPPEASPSDLDSKSQRLKDERGNGEEERKPTRTFHSSQERLHGVDGAASTVNFAKDPESYRETAVANLKIRAGGKDQSEHLPIVNAKDMPLSDIERAELDDWMATRRKSEAAAEGFLNKGSNVVGTMSLDADKKATEEASAGAGSAGSAKVVADLPLPNSHKEGSQRANPPPDPEKEEKATGREKDRGRAKSRQEGQRPLKGDGDAHSDDDKDLAGKPLAPPTAGTDESDTRDGLGGRKSGAATDGTEAEYENIGRGKEPIKGPKGAEEKGRSSSSSDASPKDPGNVPEGQKEEDWKARDIVGNKNGPGSGEGDAVKGKTGANGNKDEQPPKKDPLAAAQPRGRQPRNFVQPPGPPPPIREDTGRRGR